LVHALAAVVPIPFQLGAVVLLDVSPPVSSAVRRTFTGEKAMRGVARRSSLGFFCLGASACLGPSAGLPGTARAAQRITNGRASLMTAPIARSVRLSGIVR